MLMNKNNTPHGCLDCSAIDHSLIKVDGLAKLHAVEEFLDQMWHIWDTSRITDEDNFVHVALVNASRSSTSRLIPWNS